MQQGLDTVIVEALREDSRTPFLAIAKKNRVSEGTIRNRVRKLVQNGRILRFTIEVGDDSLVEALIGVRVQAKVPTDRVVKRLLAVDGVSRAYETAGHFDVLLVAQTSGLEALNAVLEKVRQTPEVLETESFTVLKKHG